MALKWIDLKKYLVNVIDENVLKTTVRFQEHHHGRMLTCYPLVRNCDDGCIALIIDWSCNIRDTIYHADELKIREQSEGKRLTYNNLNQLLSIMPDEVLDTNIKAISYNEDGTINTFDFNEGITIPVDPQLQIDFGDGYHDYSVENIEQPILSLTA